MKQITEGKAVVYVPTAKTVSKDLQVFYNPVMSHNRDICMLILNTLKPKTLCFPLAASGVRPIRAALELDYKPEIVANDINKGALKLIERNTKKNRVSFKIQNKDANTFLYESKGFDYIDLDVFGSPNFVLDSAITRLSRNGILAVTATDTGALCGTYPKAGFRKYWSKPLKCDIMHELGLRILIRKIQLVASQYGKALLPILCYSKDHYFRLYSMCEKSKEKVDKLNYGYIIYCKKCLVRNSARDVFNAQRCSCKSNFDYAGPLWLGKFADSKILNNLKIPKNVDYEKALKFLETIKQESEIDSVGFYNISKLAKARKIRSIKKIDEIIKSLKKKKFKASRTHFDGQGVRSNAGIENIF